MLFLVVHDAAVFKGDHALAEVVDDGFVVGGDEDGGAEVVDALEQLNDFFAGEFIKVTGGLVGDEDFGLAGDGTGDGDALLFPTREVGGKLVGFVGESD